MSPDVLPSCSFIRIPNPDILITRPIIRVLDPDIPPICSFIRALFCPDILIILSIIRVPGPDIPLIRQIVRAILGPDVPPIRQIIRVPNPANPLILRIIRVPGSPLRPPTPRPLNKRNSHEMIFLFFGSFMRHILWKNRVIIRSRQVEQRSGLAKPITGKTKENKRSEDQIAGHPGGSGSRKPSY